MTVDELLRRRDTDPDYQAKIVAKEELLTDFKARWREAEQPIVASLAEVGIEVDSPWDLVNMQAPYFQAHPILVQYLERGGLPDRVAEGLARALAVKSAAPYWSRLAAVFRRALGPDEHMGLGVALSVSATRDNVDELVALVEDASVGNDRIFLLKPLLKFAGERGKDVVQQLQDDPYLGKEATRLLRRSRSR